LLLPLMLNGAWAQGTEDDWGDDDWALVPESPWQFNGFLEAAAGKFLQDNSVQSTSSLMELRNRLELNYSHDLFELSAKGDLLYNELVSDTQWQTREFNISASPLDYLDIKLGRQVLTWGTGDYLFLNDLFAKDWQSFFSGREDEYLKAPSDSLRTSWYLGDFSLDIAWTPEFTPDNYLTGARFSFYSPMAGAIIAPGDDFAVETRDDGQWSARLATSSNGVEYALYGYHGYWTTPQGANQAGQGYFPRLNTWGASVRMPLGQGLFNTEFAYYHSLEDKGSNKANVANSQIRFLLGYEQELMKNLTAGVQYYLEKTQDYDAMAASSPAPETLVDENRQLLTLRLTYRAMQQKLTYSLFGFYSPTDSDAYLRPSISYRQDDNWSYALGANVFLGKHEYSFFGQHQDNTNAWLRVRYQF